MVSSNYQNNAVVTIYFVSAKNISIAVVKTMYFINTNWTQNGETMTHAQNGKRIADLLFTNMFRLFSASKSHSRVGIILTMSRKVSTM